MGGRVVSILLTNPIPQAQYKRREAQHVFLSTNIPQVLTRVAAEVRCVWQEEVNLQNQVDKLVALQPDIILVERSVARTAQEELLERGISLALNMKRSVLDFLSRCTGAEVWHHSLLPHCLYVFPPASLARLL